MPNPVSMSDAEAKAEYDSIQREIAESKGHKVEDPVGDEPKEGEGEPGDDKDPKVDPPAADPVDVDPKDPEPKDDRIPLKKFLDTKNTLESEKADLKATVEKLTADLQRATTSKGMSEKIKVFSEKHGMEQAAALDLVQLVLDEVKPTEATQKIEHFIKKQETDEKFEHELSALLADSPEALERANEIRALAFEEGNLDKSLYEIYHRFVKPTEKKKTGESSRVARPVVRTGFDIKSVMDKVAANTPGALNGLTDEQVDQVFAAMEKTGSRYK